jgi:hypothetical protein
MVQELTRFAQKGSVVLIKVINRIELGRRKVLNVVDVTLCLNIF